MTKASSMAAVLRRTCPRCLTMVDPVLYGWHLSKCSSNSSICKAASPPANPRKDEWQSSAPDTVVICAEAPALLPDTCPASLAPDSQLVGDGGIVEKAGEAEENVLIDLRREKNVLINKIEDLELQLKELRHQFHVEKQSWADKLRCLELNVKELECQSRKSQELEREAVGLLESLRGSAGKENRKHTNEAGHCDQLLDVVSCELRTLSSDKQCIRLGDGLASDDSQRNAGNEQNEHLVHAEENAGKSILMKNNKSCELDSLVELACTGEPVSYDFLSKVDHLIDSQRSATLTRKCDRIQEVLHSDIHANIDDEGSSESNNGPLAACGDGPPSTLVLDQQHQTASKDSCFQLVNEKGSLTILREDNLRVEKPHGSNFHLDECEDGQPNGSSLPQINSCGPNLDTQGAAIEKACEVLNANKNSDRPPEFLCRDQFQAKKANPLSVSLSSESEFNVAKTKAGSRRLVLSDSKSDGVISQDAPIEKQPDFCTSKISNMSLPSSHNAGLMAGDTFTENHGSGKLTQPSLQRTRRRSMVVQSSDDVACSNSSEHSSQRSAEGPTGSSNNLKGAALGVVGDGKPGETRRSKRLGMLSTSKTHSKDPGKVLSRRKVHCINVPHSSSSETSRCLHGSKNSNLKATSSTHGHASRNPFKEPHKRKLFQRVDASSSSSAETSSQDEGLPHKRSKRSSTVRRKLFSDDVSKPAYGDNHLTDSEADESEVESDDSLNDFLTDSEGLPSQSVSNYQSLSGSHSSKAVYYNPRLRREIKVRHYVWEVEPEMLSAFAVNPELCLRAVCAMNRRQTEDEQSEKASKYVNNRGFSMSYANRGTRIAEFLTDGNPEGPVKKSVEDLKNFDTGGLEFCKMIASMHSKQLFDIYMNAEDPHFPFS